ncbi:unnamed protein product [Anisakis simplex]|uniref:Adaptin_N domain-containing protein n=1 Tax=Anisakis simplex TaxID=6269 RepID=A0A0M3JSQ1_ANISI|nr:unnamed protein product [Anisakis simplex]
MSQQLLLQLDAAESCASLVSAFEALKVLADDAPERIAPYLVHIQNAFVEKSSDVRRLAYQCAIKYACAHPSASGYFTTAYITALLHEQQQIVADALSYLPQFIAHSRSHSEILLKAAADATSCWSTPEMQSDLSFAASAAPLDVNNNGDIIQRQL